MPDTYFGTFEDLESDPERGRDEEYEAWQDSLLEQEPPEEERPCPACGDSLSARFCSVCSMARPEGGERDDN